MEDKRAASDMHPEDIKAAIRKRGWTLRDVARAYGLPEDDCQKALRRPMFGGEHAIAEVMGLSPRQIWPSRYLPEGPRDPTIRIRRHSKATTPRFPSNDQLHEAA
ncbi:MAG: helix-turn-helix transcriptional regulator [Rhodospirillaceae bacterium]